MKFRVEVLELRPSGAKVTYLLQNFMPEYEAEARASFAKMSERYASDRFEVQFTDLSLMTLTARREYGPHHDPDHATTYGGKWVVRDDNGNVIDVDKYQNDLRDRYPGLVVEGN